MLNRALVVVLLLVCACDSAVAWCVANGGDPDQCAEQWGRPLVCEPVVQSDGTTCCEPGTGTPEQPQCGE
jgi:hypothetical protein